MVKLNPIGCFLIVCLSLCLSTTYAGQKNITLNSEIDQMQIFLNQSDANYSTCYSVYNNRLAEVNAKSANETQVCYDTSDIAKAANYKKLNLTLIAVNALSIQLQNRLSFCAERNIMEDIFNCYIITFDNNLGNLHNLSAQSQVAVVAITGYTKEIQIAREACVAKALMCSKIDSISAYNELQTCLSAFGALDSKIREINYET